MRLLYQTNEGFSQSFENIAQGIVIDDEKDEDKCRQARELLGFDRDYPYDTEVVDKFNDMACGEDFTTYDHWQSHCQHHRHLMKLNLKPRSMTMNCMMNHFSPNLFQSNFSSHITFRYPDDPELTFEKLRPRTFEVPELYTTGKKGWNVIQNMKYSKIVIDDVAKYAKIFYELAKEEKTSACTMAPELMCIPVFMGNGGCMNYPAKVICNAAGFLIVRAAWFLWQASEVAAEILDHTIFHVSMIKPSTD
jgi:hypothetical protein